MSHELAVRALAEAPCDGCRHARRCAARELACNAYVAFLEGDRRWRHLPRVAPTRGRYDDALGLMRVKAG
jgi:hypothetical protein